MTLILVAWVVLAPPVALLLGLAIRTRGADPSLDEHFDGVPVCSLSPAEVDRRAARLDVRA